MTEKQHLTEEGFNKIRKIASTMNRSSQDKGLRESPFQDENLG